MIEVRIGVDPGLSGAIAALLDDQVLDYYLFETMQTSTRKMIDPIGVIQFLDRVRKRFAGAPPPQSHAFIEQVGGIQGQAAGAAFTFGRATGAVEACVAVSGLAYSHVPPGTWKRRAGLIGAGKDGPRSRALQLWPDLEILRLKGKGQAVADALLVAKYGK